jgi:hypothetical protein
VRHLNTAVLCLQPQVHILGLRLLALLQFLLSQLVAVAVLLHTTAQVVVAEALHITTTFA